MVLERKLTCIPKVTRGFIEISSHRIMIKINRSAKFYVVGILSKENRLILYTT
jgi:hypothetical protein